MTFEWNEWMYMYQETVSCVQEKCTRTLQIKVGYRNQEHSINCENQRILQSSSCFQSFKKKFCQESLVKFMDQWQGSALWQNQVSYRPFDIRAHKVFFPKWQTVTFLDFFVVIKVNCIRSAVTEWHWCWDWHREVVLCQDVLRSNVKWPMSDHNPFTW